MMANQSTYILVLLLFLCSDSLQDYPFNNPKLSWTTRVNDLVKRLTLDEITQQMAQGGRTTHAPGIPRLNIKPYPWGSECLRGDVGAGPATSFPQALGLAASFSRKLLFDVTMVTGEEVRAKFNNYSAHGDYGMHTSASCWSPVINIMRDPLWGRNQETYGEDPYLSGELSAAYVKGLQGTHPRYIMANAGCKHFDAYGGPENIPISRHKFNAKVKEEDLRNTFYPAFKKCVQAGTYSIMCSYNSVNGVPACANKKLLTDVLRHEWGFNGYVISDEGAIEDIMDNHNYTHTREDTAATAIKAGTNLEDGPPSREPYFSAISKAVSLGKINETIVREAVMPLFYTRMRLGLFDPPEMNPYSQLNVTSIVQARSHRNLAVIAALKSFVLLKNLNNTLPIISKKGGKPFQKIAILGPMANNTQDIFGNYAPEPDPKFITTPASSLSSLGQNHSIAPGCEDSICRCIKYDGESIQRAVKGANIVVVCLGTGVGIEGESNDRKDIELPGKQFQLLQDVVTSAEEEVPIILLLFNGGPLNITWAVSNPAIKVIVECFFPAQGTGEALLKMFLNEGERSNPAGRLPATWPISLNQYPPITDYTLVNRTYRYLDSQPLFPFGYGLSYTTFQYMTLDVRPKVLRFGDIIFVDVYLVNNGPYDGEEVIQIYVSWPNKKLPSTPNIQFVEFDRQFIKSGEGITCSFKIAWDGLALWSVANNRFEVPLGVYALYAGGQLPNQSTNVPSNVLKTTFKTI